VFKPTDAQGLPVPPEDLQLAVAVQQGRPVHGGVFIRGLDGEQRELIVTAIPLQGQWGEPLGAAAIFWEAE
jgi:hypothetical protein